MPQEEIKPIQNDLNKANVEQKPVQSVIPDRITQQSIVMEVRNSKQETTTKVNTQETGTKEQ